MGKESIDKKIMQRLASSALLLELRAARAFQQAGLVTQARAGATASYRGFTATYATLGAPSLRCLWQVRCLPHPDDHLLIYKAGSEQGAKPVSLPRARYRITNRAGAKMLDQVIDQLPMLSAYTSAGMGLDDLAEDRSHGWQAADLAVHRAVEVVDKNARNQAPYVVFPIVITAGSLYDVSLSDDDSADIRRCEFSTTLHPRDDQLPTLVDVMTESYVLRYAQLAHQIVQRLSDLLVAQEPSQVSQFSKVKGGHADPISAWDRFRHL